jgi:hypothetical protein
MATATRPRTENTPATAPLFWKKLGEGQRGSVERRNTHGVESELEAPAETVERVAETTEVTVKVGCGAEVNTGVVVDVVGMTGIAVTEEEEEDDGEGDNDDDDDDEVVDESRVIVGGVDSDIVELAVAAALDRDLCVRRRGRRSSIR